MQRTTCGCFTVDIPWRNQADGGATALDRDDGLLSSVVHHRPAERAAPRFAGRHHRPVERLPATAAGGENEFEHFGAGLAGQRVTAAAAITVKPAQVQQAPQNRNVTAAQELGRRARKRRLRVVVRYRAAEGIVLQQPDRLELKDRLRRATGDAIGDRQHINQPLTDRWRILIVAECHRPVEVGEPAFRLRRQHRSAGRRRQLPTLRRGHALNQQRRHMLAVEADRARAGSVDADLAVRPDSQLDGDSVRTPLRPLHPAFNARAVVGHVGNEGPSPALIERSLFERRRRHRPADVLEVCAAARTRPRCCLDASETGCSASYALGMVTTRRYERKVCRRSGNRPRRTSCIGGAYAGDARTVPSVPQCAAHQRFTAAEPARFGRQYSHDATLATPASSRITIRPCEQQPSRHSLLHCPFARKPLRPSAVHLSGQHSIRR